VIAPLFLGQVKSGQSRRKVDANSDIPDLFSGGPTAAPAPAPSGTANEATPISTGTTHTTKVAEVSTAPAEVSGSTTYSTTQFIRKPPADLGELFGQPGKRNWTPNDIVQNTCRIRGVSGAVIAMQDGLLVAAQVASPWKSEATAAFLPQIYSRLNQYLKELSVGEMSSVTLTTGNGTLFVFNAGIIYFAVISKPEEVVPLAPIKLIVSELSRHTK
jgi:predicted regulator of Ras-like GTPase activity (Roadblock/LC7/MglB family)